MKHALIVEDIPETRTWMGRILALAFPGIAVRAAATLEGARRLLDDPLDLALIDLNLPDGFGAEFIVEVKGRFPAAVCVVATTFDDDEHLFPSLQAGADGYLLKDMTVEQIQNLLLGIQRGIPPLSPAVAQRLLGHFRAPLPTVPSRPELTPREQETLALIAKGLSIKEAAAILDLSQHTVGGYVKEIYRKLGIGSRAEAALEASRMGLFAKD